MKINDILSHPIKLRNLKLLALLSCTLGSLFVLYQFLLQGSTSLMIPQLMSSLCLDLTDISILSSLFFYPYIILQIPSGFLIDKYGPRLVLLCSTALLCAATIFFSICKCYSTANISRFIMGSASAPGVACAMSLAAKWYPKKFTIVAAIIEMTGMIGGAIGDYLLSYTTLHVGWRLTMFLCGLIGLVLLILIYCLVSDDVSCKTNDKTNKKHRYPNSNYREVFGSISIWQSCFYGGMMFALISAFASLWSIPFISSIYPTTSSQLVSRTSALIFIGAAIGTLISAYISNRSSIKFTKILFSCSALVIFSIILFIPISYIAMNVLLFILGISSGSYILSFSSVEKLVPPNIKGLAMGFTNMVIVAIGGPILQPIIGIIINKKINHSSIACHFSVNINIYQIALLPILIALILSVLIGLTIKKK